MHDTAMRTGGLFFRSYLDGSPRQPKRVLDVGGLNVNGTLRSVAPNEWSYVSVDMVAGKGVDVVLDDPYKLPFPDSSFDGVVSTSCFEHDAFFWLTFIEMLRVTKLGGYVYVNAPSGGMVHRFPVDAWRFYPDAGPALAEWAKRCGVEVTLCESFVADMGPEGWSDFVAIYRKGTFPDAAARPIHEDIPCCNVHTIGSSDVLHPREDLSPVWTIIRHNMRKTLTQIRRAIRRR
jgi:SAM-dependent methyltransferase